MYARKNVHIHPRSQRLIEDGFSKSIPPLETCVKSAVDTGSWKPEYKSTSVQLYEVVTSLSLFSDVVNKMLYEI